MAKPHLHLRISEQGREEIRELARMMNTTLTAATEIAVRHTLASLQQGQPIYHRLPPERPGDGHKSA